METFSAGAIVLVPFPFSDLSAEKLRPAIVLAEADKGDWILCQVTSQRYSDPFAIAITAADLRVGSLTAACYARPTRIFTASDSLIRRQVGNLTDKHTETVITALIQRLESNIP